MVVRVLLCRNPTVRENCFEYLRIVLEGFDTSRLEPHCKQLLEAVRVRPTVSSPCQLNTCAQWCLGSFVC